MSIFPPYLKTGDKVGITCPAGAVSDSDIQYMVEQWRQWGFEVLLGETVGTSYYKFSAPDEQRLQDLQRMLDDDSIKAILFGRGGYGMVRIIDRLDFSRFVQHPKWLVGYSDITCLHSHVQRHYGIATLHAHMQAGYKPEEQHEESTHSLLASLMGEPIRYQIPLHILNRIGHTQGHMVGGNLALLSDLCGTNSDIHTDGKILFIEDISEYKYNIDRMLWQLKKSDKLCRLAGLLVGSFTDTMDNEVPFGMSEYEMVYEKVAPYSYPVCFGFPVGHQSHNLALVCGVKYQLDVRDDGVSLQIVE